MACLEQCFIRNITPAHIILSNGNFSICVYFYSATRENRSVVVKTKSSLLSNRLIKKTSVAGFDFKQVCQKSCEMAIPSMCKA